MNRLLSSSVPYLFFVQQGEVFEHPANLVTGDRGVHSAETPDALEAAGVKRVSIPGSRQAFGGTPGGAADPQMEARKGRGEGL